MSISNQENTPQTCSGQSDGGGGGARSSSQLRVPLPNPEEEEKKGKEERDGKLGRGEIGRERQIEKQKSHSSRGQGRRVT